MNKTRKNMTIENPFLVNFKLAQKKNWIDVNNTDSFMLTFLIKAKFYTAVSHKT